MGHEETMTTPAHEARVEDAPAVEAKAAPSDPHEEPMTQHHPAEDSAPTAPPATEAPPNQTEEYLALAQRTRAEFANYKKRVERELGESRSRGALDAVARVLPIIDDFERAMSNVPADLAGHSWVSGVGLMLRKFEKLLGEFEVEVIDPVGQPFDPSRHEALGMDDSDSVESGHITVTLQKGYAAGDRVLRPALVRVAN